MDNQILIIFKIDKEEMVLTATQQKQLNKDILEYLVKNQYKATAEQFATEIQVSLSDIDPESNKLQVKWKSILTLQKKITKLEQENTGLKQQIQKLPNKKATNTNASDLFMLKQPPKYEMKGHKSSITSMAFHPQFTQLATSSEDGSIKIWQFQTGDFQRTLKGHTNPVNCVNYDKQGKYLASSSSDLTIKLWDLNNDYLCFKTLFGHNHNVSYVGFTPQGDSVISSSRDKTIKLWQTSTGYCKKTYVGHEGWVRKVALTQDGKSFASVSDDQSIIFWNIAKQTPVNRFFAHDNVIQTLLLIQGDQSSKLINAQFLKHKFTPQIKMNALKQLNAQGKQGLNNYFQTFVLSAGRDKLIKLFILQTGELLHTFYGHDNWVRGLSLHFSGNYLYSASDDRSIRIWDMNFGKEKKKIQAHQHFISTVLFNQKYGIVASGGNDLAVKIWHLKAI